jgi:hypothetical protein
MRRTDGAALLGMATDRTTERFVSAAVGFPSSLGL